MKRTSPRVVLVAALMLSACSELPTDIPLGEPDVSASPLVGVPIDGFPNYQERLLLTAMNRARADPNNVAAGTAGACDGVGRNAYSSQPPLMWDYKAARASRFHTNNLARTGSGLSHTSYCSLRSDVDASNCDGSQSCACTPGTECFSCTVNGGCGTTWSARQRLFGFAGRSNIGASSYRDAWDANVAWMAECKSYDGHRYWVTYPSINYAGTGYGSGGSCASRFYFSDLGYELGRAIARLPSGAHRPELGTATTEFSFYVNYHDPAGAPQSVYAVVDGQCRPMTRELGTMPGTATFVARSTVGDGCHQYWFLARDASGARHIWPEAGAYGVGNCSSYLPTAMAASCEQGNSEPPPVLTCTAGTARTCGVGVCAGTESCTSTGTWTECNGPDPLAAETCNGLDDDCDGVVPATEADADGDGVRACGGDCNDRDATVFPGAPESCTGVDNNCDGIIAPDNADLDGDGIAACAGDCDDGNPAIRPGARELCNGIDEDCDGQTDEACFRTKRSKKSR